MTKKAPIDRGLRTMFVGGVRHGHTVDGQPDKEGELYRVPARTNGEKPVDYKAAEVTLTFPHPVTGQPGDTYSCFVYTIPDLYPDNPQRAQNLQAAMSEAALRLYIMGNGINTTGGPEAVAAQRIPIYVAWCEDCHVKPDEAHEYETLKERAAYINNHNASTGHLARWEDRER